MTPSQENAGQLKLLSVLYLVWGGLAILGSLACLAYAVFGFYVKSHPEVLEASEGLQTSSRVSGSTVGQIIALFGIAGFIISVLFGILNLWVGTSLRKTKGYLLTFIMACLNCLNLPLGTALGIFTLMVINRPDIKQALRQISSPPVPGNPAH